MWENLGRVGAEFAHLDRMKVLDLERGGEADLVYDRITVERFLAIRDSGKPTLVFSAHLANWEVPALAPASYDVRSNLLYRRPNIGGIADAIVAMRAGCMGNLIPTGLDAPVRLLHALERGEHVGMLVDQHMVQGRRCRVLRPLGQGKSADRAARAALRRADPRRARGAAARRQSLLAAN